MILWFTPRLRLSDILALAIDRVWMDFIENEGIGIMSFTLWFLVFVLMLLIVAAMAVGVMMGRRPIAGSCGGIASLGIEKECSFCGGVREICESRQAENAKKSPQ